MCPNVNTSLFLFVTKSQVISLMSQFCLSACDLLTSLLCLIFDFYRMKLSIWFTFFHTKNSINVFKMMKTFVLEAHLL